MPCTRALSWVTLFLLTPTSCSFYSSSLFHCHELLLELGASARERGKWGLFLSHVPSSRHLGWNFTHCLAPCPRELHPAAPSLPAPFGQTAPCSPPLQSPGERQVARPPRFGLSARGFVTANFSGFIVRVFLAVLWFEPRCRHVWTVLLALLPSSSRRALAPTVCRGTGWPRLLASVSSEPSPHRGRSRDLPGFGIFSVLFVWTRLQSRRKTPGLWAAPVPPALSEVLLLQRLKDQVFDPCL